MSCSPGEDCRVSLCVSRVLLLLLIVLLTGSDVGSECGGGALTSTRLSKSPQLLLPVIDLVWSNSRSLFRQAAGVRQLSSRFTSRDVAQVLATSTTLVWPPLGFDPHSPTINILLVLLSFAWSGASSDVVIIIICRVYWSLHCQLRLGRGRWKIGFVLLGNCQVDRVRVVMCDHREAGSRAHHCLHNPVVAGLSWDTGSQDQFAAGSDQERLTHGRGQLKNLSWLLEDDSLAGGADGGSWQEDTLTALTMTSDTSDTRGQVGEDDTTLGSVGGEHDTRLRTEHHRDSSSCTGSRVQIEYLLLLLLLLSAGVVVTGPGEADRHRSWAGQDWSRAGHTAGALTTTGHLAHWSRCLGDGNGTVANIDRQLTVFGQQPQNILMLGRDWSWGWLSWGGWDCGHRHFLNWHFAVLVDNQRHWVGVGCWWCDGGVVTRRCGWSWFTAAACHHQRCLALQQIILQTFIDGSFDPLLLVIVDTNVDRFTRSALPTFHGFVKNVLNDVLDDLLSSNGTLLTEIHRTVLLGWLHQFVLLLLEQSRGHLAPHRLSQSLEWLRWIIGRAAASLWSLGAAPTLSSRQLYQSLTRCCLRWHCRAW